jgi:hypothetical protein
MLAARLELDPAPYFQELQEPAAPPDKVKQKLSFQCLPGLVAAVRAFSPEPQTWAAAPMAVLVVQKLLVLKPLDLMFAAVKQLAETVLSFQSLPAFQSLLEQPFAA